jgi:uncharacterized protein YcbK (DUF882 family)
MQSKGKPTRRRRFASRSLLLVLVTISLFLARDAPARALVAARQGTEVPLAAGLREARVTSWATALEPVIVTSASTGATTRISLYDRFGEIDQEARASFERVASREPEAHRLSLRVEQVVFKAAYHFGAPRLFVVSGWREHGGRHTNGEAIDFRLAGISPAIVAAYLRGLPRLGVGIYTHPGTQFVHVDVREPSFHWIDASPPGVHWSERQIRDGGMAKRDAMYAPEMDLP